MKISWILFRNIRVHLFYLSESDSPKFLSDSRTLGYIKGLFHHLCDVSFEKSDYFLPPFIFNSCAFFSTQISEKRKKKLNFAQIYLVVITLFLLSQNECFLNLNYSLKCELSPHSGIMLIEVLQLEILTFPQYCPG